MSLERIIDQPSHDAAVNAASRENPIVIYVVSDANPICARTTPKIEDLAKKHAGKVQFYRMELTQKTQPMIKFSVANTPILIAMNGISCSTLLGGDMRTLEKDIDRMLSQQQQV